MTAFAPMFDPPFFICEACCSVLLGLRRFKDWMKAAPEYPSDEKTTPTRGACPYVERVFTNGGLGRLLFCRLKEEESMSGINPVKRFFLKLTGHFLCDCPDCFR